MKKFFCAMLIGLSVLAVASSAQLSVGVDPVAEASGVSALALRYDFAGGIVGKVGLNYQNVSSPSSSTTAYGAQLAYALPNKIGKVTPLIGVNFSSNGAATATTVLSLKLGAELALDNVLLSAGITPYASTSTGGASSSTISTDSVWIAVYIKI